ncbi:MAG: hypothetical protein NTW97_05615 [Candidatus Krumholzibacteria bacterium]|nr:hypothetical protein [Candidatus Krumholzibacteria bacterium]
MRRLFGIVSAIALLAAAVSAYAGVPKELEPLEFLLGKWEASGGGKPGEAAGSATFARGLQGRVIIRTSYAEYSASAQAPASRHDDLMVIYVSDGSGIRADYYDNEGHVIRYAVMVTGPGEASFVSEIAGGAPRFRLSYKLGSDGILKGEFAMAPPGKPEAFAPYLVWESRKAK